MPETDDELASLKREAGEEERGEQQRADDQAEQFIESTERRLRRLFKNLGHLPAPLDFDEDEQSELAEVWAPIAKDWDVAADVDAPAWLKWGTALVVTSVIAAPKIMAARAIVAHAERTDEREPEQPADAGEGTDDAEA